MTTMKKLTAALFALLVPAALAASEHPKEHPTAANSVGGEHPKAKGAEHPSGDVKGHEHPMGGAEHPAGKPHEHPVGSKAWNKQMSKEYNKAVVDYVEKSAGEGAFKVSDDKLGKEWALKLVRVHKNKIAHLGEGRFFACADFKAVGEKAKVDLDFYAMRGEDGSWSMEKVLVHKVDGKARYTYNDKNEMVPVN